ncbi:MAG: TetR/AcrR family transcriptional regulator [Clostridia bacterium]|nr:TetR/AcrR family transcriptional regulator [Clostridia bacterium]
MGSNIYTQQQLAFSKNCLFDALLKLLQEKEFEKITVTELTRVADVSRATFYRYYTDVGDVLRDFLDSRPMGFPADMTYEDHTPRELVELYFDYLVTNQELFKILVTAPFLNSLRMHMERTFQGGVFQPIIEKMGYRTKYEISAFIGMVFNVVVDWFSGGMKEPVEEMIEESTKLITSFDFGNKE